MDYRELEFPALQEGLHAIAAEAHSTFGGLSAVRLNWKPGAQSWSIAQCLDHLLTANGEYLPIFDAILQGRKKAKLAERLPWLPRIWGSLLIKALSPDSTRRLKAPKIFQPAISGIDTGVVLRFREQQEKLLERMAALAEQGLGAVVITSPVSFLVTYSALDACRVIVAHGKRHLLQARRVLDTPGFPKR